MPNQLPLNLEVAAEAVQNHAKTCRHFSEVWDTVAKMDFDRAVEILLQNDVKSFRGAYFRLWNEARLELKEANFAAAN